jgi:thiazole/oxazole-forming peptide maturase SagD family component
MVKEQKNRRLNIPRRRFPIAAMTKNIAEAIAVLGRALAPDFKITPMHASDAPIFMAVAWPTSETVTGLKPRLPAGRGTTLQQALLSAGAEALELRASLAQNHAHELPQRVQDQGQVKAVDLLRGDDVSVSAQDVYLDFAAFRGEVLRHDADSTGCATGTTRQQAICHALLECIERDAMATWWYGRMQRPSVPLEVIDGLQPRLFWWLQERGRQTMLLDLTSDTGVPTVAAVSSQEDGSLVAIGTAARFNPRDAALAAVTEMIQTETAMAHASEAGDLEFAAWLDCASTRSMLQFQPLSRASFETGPDVDMDTILRGLAYGNHRAVSVELTLPNDPLPTMRVIVPGFCAMGGRINVARLHAISGRRVDLAKLTKEDLLEPF